MSARTCPACGGTHVSGLVAAFWVSLDSDGDIDWDKVDPRSETELTGLLSCQDCSHEWGVDDPPAKHHVASMGARTACGTEPGYDKPIVASSNMLDVTCPACIRAKGYDEVLLGALRHKVYVQDGQVIFEQADNIWGLHSRLALERPKEINDSPGTWQLVDVDNTFDKGVSMGQLVRAFEYVKNRFGADFKPYKEEIA